MVRAWLILLLLCLPWKVSAQDYLREADSLVNVLGRNLPDKNKVDILNKIAPLYYNHDLKNCVLYANKALDLANQINYTRGEERALSMLNRAQRRMGNFSVALEFNLRQINLDEKLRDTLLLIDGYTSLGHIYTSLKNYTEAKNYYNMAYAFGKMLHIKNLSSIINFSGRVYTQTGMYDSALFWLMQALQLETKSPQGDHTLSYIYINLGEVYYFKKRYEVSINYYRKSLDLPEEMTTPFGVTSAYSGLALVFLGTKNFTLAKNMALKSISISRKQSYRDKTKESFGILYRIYESSGDYKNALSYYQQFNAIQDSIFSEDKLQYIENLRIYFETERVAQENELLRKDTELKDVRIKQGQYFILVALVSSVSLLIILLFLYINYRQKQNTNTLLSDYNKNLEDQVELRTRELVKTNMELIKQNSQLEQFGYITAHNLRAPVARILGLANIINNKHFSMPADKEILDKLQLAALELDNIIYDLNVILDIKKGIQFSYEEIDLHLRFEKVKSILKDKIRDSKLTIIENFAAAPTCYAISAYIESILYNLISNSIKYRALERDPVIYVTSQTENEKLKLTIKDNGIGMDLQKTKEKLFSLYQRFHDHVEGKGIGLFLVKTQVEVMNGSVEIESYPDKGTTFFIYLPLKKTNA